MLAGTGSAGLCWLVIWLPRTRLGRNGSFSAGLWGVRLMFDCWKFLLKPVVSLLLDRRELILIDPLLKPALFLLVSLLDPSAWLPLEFCMNDAKLFDCEVKLFLVDFIGEACILISSSSACLCLGVRTSWESELWRPTKCPMRLSLSCWANCRFGSWDLTLKLEPCVLKEIVDWLGNLLKLFWKLLNWFWVPVDHGCSNCKDGADDWKFDPLLDKNDCSDVDCDGAVEGVDAWANADPRGCCCLDKLDWRFPPFCNNSINDLRSLSDRSWLKIRWLEMSWNYFDIILMIEILYLPELQLISMSRALCISCEISLSTVSTVVLASIVSPLLSWLSLSWTVLGAREVVSLIQFRNVSDSFSEINTRKG